MKTSETVAYRCTILALLTVCFTFSTISSIASDAESASKPPSPRAATAEYQVQPGDRLFISVWREETLQREVTVRPDGGIRFPLAGEINATGLSLADIEQRLKGNLSSYIPDPVVSVSLIQSAGNRIYVVGRVNNPGEYVLSRNINVLQAIALAGGMTPFAKRNKIKILRKEKGNQRVFYFNYKEVEKGQGVNQNIQLMAGDTIVVP